MKYHFVMISSSLYYLIVTSNRYFALVHLLSSVTVCFYCACTVVLKSYYLSNNKLHFLFFVSLSCLSKRSETEFTHQGVWVPSWGQSFKKLLPSGRTSNIIICCIDEKTSPFDHLFPLKSQQNTTASVNHKSHIEKSLPCRSNFQ